RPRRGVPVIDLLRRADPRRRPGAAPADVELTAAAGACGVSDEKVPAGEGARVLAGAAGVGEPLLVEGVTPTRISRTTAENEAFLTSSRTKEAPCSTCSPLLVPRLPSLAQPLPTPSRPRAIRKTWLPFELVRSTRRTLSAKQTLGSASPTFKRSSK